jgi:hypothetical protein
MMKEITILAVLLIVLVSGCVDNANQLGVICNDPYIQKGTECCLDTNSNSICDSDESSTETPSEKQNNTTINNTPTPQEQPDSIKECYIYDELFKDWNRVFAMLCTSDEECSGAISQLFGQDMSGFCRDTTFTRAIQNNDYLYCSSDQSCYDQLLLTQVIQHLETTNSPYTEKIKTTTKCIEGFCEVTTGTQTSLSTTMTTEDILDENMTTIGYVEKHCRPSGYCVEIENLYDYEYVYEPSYQ